jgi:hypothetical protein
MASNNTGLLIIRASVESGSSARLRARIRLTSDVSVGFKHTLTLDDKDVVAGVVQSWLDDILDGSAAGSGALAGATQG